MRRGIAKSDLRRPAAKAWAHPRPMITTLLHLLRRWPFLCAGHRLAIENLAVGLTWRTNVAGAAQSHTRRTILARSHQQ